MKTKIVTINEYNECVTRLVILLEIVMVIPGKHESLSRTNESQFKKQQVQSSKCLDLSSIQTVNLKAESKTREAREWAEPHSYGNLPIPENLVMT